jgi:hypothetical protein
MWYRAVEGEPTLNGLKRRNGSAGPDDSKGHGLKRLLDVTRFGMRIAHSVASAMKVTDRLRLSIRSLAQDIGAFCSKGHISIHCWARFAYGKHDHTTGAAFAAAVCAGDTGGVLTNASVMQRPDAEAATIHT